MLHIIRSEPDRPTGLHRIKCQHGLIQLVCGADNLLIDASSREIGVDGVSRWGHAAFLMSADEIAQLYGALAGFLAPLRRAA